MKEVGILLKVGQTGLENIDKLSRYLEGVGVETTALDAKAAELAAELKRLAAEQGLIDNFKRTKTAVADAGGAMEATKEIATTLGREMAQIEAPTKAQEKAFAAARVEARAASDAFQAQQLALQALRTQMAAAGIAGNDLAGAQLRVHAETQRLKDGLVSAEAAATGMVAGQRQLAATASQVEAQARALAGNLQALQQGFRGAGGEATAMGQHMDTAFRTVGVRAVKEIEEEIARLKAALFSIKAADPFGPDVQRAAAATQARIQALEAELHKVPAAAAGAKAGLDSVAVGGTSMGNSLASATTRAVAMGAALVGISSAGQAASGVLQTASAFEVLRVRLEQLLGSSKAAEEQFAAIKKLAIETPFEVSALTETYIRLANFGLKPTQSQMLALADTAAVAGGGTEALQRVTLALGQAWAKTRLQGDEILQLVEAGVPVWDLLAKATGKNVSELQHLSEAGALGRDVILKLFDAMGEKNAGASVRLMSTFSGTISNAKDAMAEFFDLIGRSGVLEQLTKKLQAALDEFDRMKNTGELERQAQKIAKAFIAFADGVQLVFDAVSKLADVLPVLLAAMVASRVIAFADALRATAVASTGAAVGMGAVSTAAPVAAAGMATAGVAAGEAAVGVGLLARSVGLLGVALRFAGITAVILGIAALAEKFYEAKKGADAADEAARKLLAGPPASEQGAKKAVNDVVAELKDFSKNLPKLASDIAALTGEGLAAVAKTTIENLRAIKAEGVAMGAAILTISERAAQVLGIELPSQAAKASIGFKAVRAEVDVLIGQLPNLKLAAQDAANVVAQALSKMVDAATTKKDFEEVSKTIKLMADAGRIGPGAVAELLKQATDRARELKEKIEANTPGIQSLGEAAKKAGVETELLTTGMRKGFADSEKAVHDLVTEIIKAGVEGSKASPVLAEALNKQAQAAQTREELEKVRAEILRARDAGKLFGSDFEAALDGVDLKLKQLSPAIRQAMADAKLLGVTLKDNVGQGAEQGVEAGLRAYERLKAGGKASADELQQAFVNLAKKAIDAADGQVPEWVKVEAALRGVSIAVDNAGRAFVQAGSNATSATASTVGGFKSVTSAIEDSVKAAIKFYSILEEHKYDDQKFALDANGQRLSASDGTLDPLLAKRKQASAQATFDAAMQAYAAATDKVQNYGNYFLVTGVSPSTTEARKNALESERQSAFVALLVAQQARDAALATGAPARSGAGTPVSSGAGTPVSTSHTVNINLPTGSRTINTASEADSQALTVILQQLSDMKARSGL